MRTHGLVLLALVAAGASIARAEDIFVPRDYGDIGAAVAAAQDGDRVVVVGGSHRDVVVEKDGIVLLGRGATLAGRTEISGRAIRVSGFRMAGDGGEGFVTISGHDAVLERNSVGLNTIVIVDGGDRARLVRNSLARTSILVRRGDDVVLRGNRVARAAEIISAGNRTLVEGNRGGAIRTGGADAVIRSNRVRIVYSQGDNAKCERNVASGYVFASGRGVSVVSNRVQGKIKIEGDDATVTGNAVTHAEAGILVTGSRASIVSNRVSAGSPDSHGWILTEQEWTGIQVDATEPGGVIEGNRVTHFRTPGIVVHADGMTVSGNTLHGVLSLTSISVVGDGNVLAGNTVTQTPGSTGGGIVFTGAGNSATRCVVESAGPCGIRVSAGAPGTVIADCTVTGCPIGVVNEAFDTEMTGTSIGDSGLVDLLDVGAFAVLEDNFYETVSHNPNLVLHR